MPAGPGQSGVQSQQTQLTVSFGFHLGLDLARVAVRGFSRRCLRPVPCRLASEQLYAQGFRTRRPGASPLRLTAAVVRPADSSFR